MTAAHPSAARAAIALVNRLDPAPNLITGGTIDAAALAAAAEAGVQSVFDLRPATERSYDEPAVCASLGLRYLNLPIAGAEDFTLATVQRFDALLAEAGAGPTILHCASGNRVGALMALRAAWLQQVPADQALATGRAHGLTRMEPIIQALLARGPA